MGYCQEKCLDCELDEMMESTEDYIRRSIEDKSVRWAWKEFFNDRGFLIQVMVLKQNSFQG